MTVFIIFPSIVMPFANVEKYIYCTVLDFFYLNLKEHGIEINIIYVRTRLLFRISKSVR